ncbi:MAG: hypothetical protein CVT64_09220 [Actinobacteria bacterium HGW-Actinobacteria-4]|nr:MAG: hypothetical protein CVT64_09220 [Actinobacteria bacterium HGW-Actinobacteria-4]
MTWFPEIELERGQTATLWLLAGFLLTFAATRFVTRRIRTHELRTAAGKQTVSSFFANIHIGGVHVHHQVWGIVMVLGVGLVHFRFAPGSPWFEILAALFGIGAALALDQFALWLHLEDVYWTAEGRKSIDAILVAATVAAALALNISPATVAERFGGPWTAAAILLAHVGPIMISFLKGKRHLGLVGLAVPLLGLVGAIRLAKPTSFWARRFYSAGRLERARARFSVDYIARWDRFRDWIGGEHGMRLPRGLEESVTESLASATDEAAAPSRDGRGPGSQDA